VLAEVDLIAAEDTRHTRKLLNHFEIATPCRSYYREREAQRSEEILTRLAAGESVALVSDAGTPGIADPGAMLVNRAREAGFTVVPIPGPSALTTLLSVAGQREAAHLFLGFLPAKAAERRRLLQDLRPEPRPLIFYESPRRLLSSLADCLAVLGRRRVLVGRELTKVHEEFQAGDLEAILAEFKARPTLKGEFVVLLAGPERRGMRPSAGPDEAGDNIEELAAWYRDQGGLSLKDASRRIAVDLDRPRSEIYRLLLDCW